MSSAEYEAFRNQVEESFREETELDEVDEAIDVILEKQHRLLDNVF